MSKRPVDLTGLLQAWSRGDRDALEMLAALVNEEMRGIARGILADERRDGRWRPTELVHEAFLRLLDWHGVDWQNRAPQQIRLGEHPGGERARAASGTG